MSRANRKFREVFPVWDPDSFKMIGVNIVDEQTCVSAFKATKAALRNKGGECPCCGQHVQVYRREIYRKMFKCFEWLIPEYHRRGGDWVNLKDGPNFRGGDNAKLRYWRLILRNPDKRSLYKPTQLAANFLVGDVSIPKYAYVYNGHVLGFSKKLVSAEDLGGFDFDRDTIGLIDEE